MAPATGPSFPEGSLGALARAVVFGRLCAYYVHVNVPGSAAGLHIWGIDTEAREQAQLSSSQRPLISISDVA